MQWFDFVASVAPSPPPGSSVLTLGLELHRFCTCTVYHRPEVSPPPALFVLTQRLVVTEDTMGGLALFQLGTNRIQRCKVSTNLVVLQIPPLSDIDWSCHGNPGMVL